MSAPIEPDDPDVRVHAAWLAQVSDAADGLVAKQVPKQDGGSTSVSAISSKPGRSLGRTRRPSSTASTPLEEIWPYPNGLGRFHICAGPSCGQLDSTTPLAFGELATAHDGNDRFGAADISDPCNRKRSGDSEVDRSVIAWRFGGACTNRTSAAGGRP